MAKEHGGRQGPAETRWWNIPGLLDAVPTTPEEAETQYHALGWLEDAVMRPAWEKQQHYTQAQGDKLEEAQKFFATKKAWNEWIKTLKTCQMTTHGVNAALAFSTKERAKFADGKAARAERLQREFPELAAVLAAGNSDARDLVWAAMDLWEVGWRRIHQAAPEEQQPDNDRLRSAA
jgi:hypothetical protein